MIYIGRIIRIGSKPGLADCGFIELFSEKPVPDLYFSYTNIHKNSKLNSDIHTKQKIYDYVVFEIIDDPYKPAAKRAHAVCYGKEIMDKDFLYNKLDFSQKFIPEVKRFLQEYCPEQFLKDTKNNDEYKTNRLSSYKIETIDSWNKNNIIEKIRIIFSMSKSIPVSAELQNFIETDLYNYECKYGDQTIAALLSFLMGGLFPKESAKRKQLIRKAHDQLVHSLTNEVKHSGSISTSQKYILPYCTHNSSMLCDATKRKLNASLYCSSDFAKMCNKHTSVYNITERHQKNIAENKEHEDIRDLLCNIDFDMEDICVLKTDDTISKYEYPYRIAAYADRLYHIKDYLECSVCGDILYPDLSNNQDSSVYSLIYFSCRHWHDHMIYINHCYRCRSMHGSIMVIDSRECKHSENELGIRTGKQKLCMRCGGSRHIPAGKYCPNCLSKNVTLDSAGYIKCSSCGHSGSSYGITPHLVNNEDYPF